jgi:hypothetical protein
VWGEVVGRGLLRGLRAKSHRRPSIEGREGAAELSHRGRESVSVAVQALTLDRARGRVPIPACRARPGALSFHQPKSAGGARRALMAGLLTSG